MVSNELIEYLGKYAGDEYVFHLSPKHDYVAVLKLSNTSRLLTKGMRNIFEDSFHEDTHYIYCDNTTVIDIININDVSADVKKIYSYVFRLHKKKDPQVSKIIKKNKVLDDLILVSQNTDNIFRSINKKKS